MKVCRKRIFPIALVLLLSMALVFPVSAAKPQKSDVGVLAISNGGSDERYHLAVGVSTEDGNYVYAGQHPIQQQICAYASVTNSLEYNNIYEIEEDTEYDEIKGVYRFAVKEKLQTGSSADVFHKVAEVKRNDTVYFVFLDVNDSNFFVMEKTAVASVRNGTLTTKDKLEEEYENEEFGVIFNDDGKVVGFCKAGVASALAGGNSGGGFVIAAVVLGAAAGLVIFLLRKKKNVASTAEDFDDSTNIVDIWDNPPVNDEPTTRALALKCHGGYLNGRTYSITAEGITIGREQDNSIRYPAQTPGISRHHVKLYWQNGQLMLVDMGSSNGTYYNKTGRLSPMRPIPLNPGDVFYLGEKLNGFEIIYK